MTLFPSTRLREGMVVLPRISLGPAEKSRQRRSHCSEDSPYCLRTPRPPSRLAALLDGSFEQALGPLTTSLIMDRDF